MIGEEGRGVPTIAAQVNYTRLGTITGTTGVLRRAVGEAIHHARHRHAFGRALADQPLMQNVLADLALESEAMTITAMRLARAYEDPAQGAFRRLATAVEKYWITKRAAPAAVEALECLGGNGYVEDSGLARLYRQAPLNSIWEGSGNIQCLDVLRALRKEPASAEAFFAELASVRGGSRTLDHEVATLRNLLTEQGGDQEARARRTVERMAMALQAACLVRGGNVAISDAFAESRLARAHGVAFGTLEPSAPLQEALIERVLPVD